MKTDKFTDTYKLGQIVWAIWQTMGAHSFTSVQEPVLRFRTRIKRILEIDRDRGRFPGIDTLAFSGKHPVTSGVDVGYTIYDALLMAIAMQLLNVGMKQFDAVFLVKSLRTDFLIPELEKILYDLPSIGRVHHRAPKGYDGPVYRKNGVRLIDERRILVIPKHEITERFSQWDSTHNIPLIEVPTICDGLDALKRLFHDELGFRYTNAIILEIGQFSARMVKNLAKAPDFKRGRG
jgi:hypothetical protein